MIIDQIKSDAPGQHIFPNDELHRLAVRWKELVAQNKSTQAMIVLERIIENSTPMFERLAQHERYTRDVELGVLIAAAQDRVVKWLMAWDPKRGKLFTFFSRCAKFAFLSEVYKVNAHRKRYHSTDDSLEKFLGAEDHEVDKHDLEADVRQRLSQITCRWGSPQEIGCIRWIIDCLVEDNARDKRTIIRSAAYAWCLPPALAKFFYGWALSELRAAFIDRVRVMLTDYDLMCLIHTHDKFIDLCQRIGIENGNLLIAVHGGERIAIPTLTTVLKNREKEKIHRAIEATDLDPASVAKVAAKFKRSAPAAADIYEEMCHALNPRRAGEYYVYGSNEGHDS